MFSNNKSCANHTHSSLNFHSNEARQLYILILPYTDVDEGNAWSAISTRIYSEFKSKVVFCCHFFVHFCLVLQCTGHAGRCNFCIENETIEMSDDYQPYFHWYFIVASQARLSPRFGLQD